jgi:cysteine-rich repeat protein
VQSVFGEQCDVGSDLNDGDYGGCNPDCTLGPRCSDGIVQSYEECDDGNLRANDGCSASCTLEPGVSGPDVVPAPVPVPTNDVFVPDVPASGTPGVARPAPDPCR